MAQQAITAEVRGFDELQRGTAELAAKIETAAGPAFDQVAQQVVSLVQGTVPKLTGALASSVGVVSSSTGSGVEMGEGVKYAGFVEYGGKGHPTSSQGNYLYPAAQAAEPLLVKAGEQAAAKEIGAMSWPRP